MSKRRQLIAGVLLAVLGFAAGYSLHLLRTSKAVPTVNIAAVSAPSLTRDLKRGEELSRSYCAACHLYPEPGLLTKREWIHHILPQVALRVGVEPANYEAMPEGRMLQEAGLYPASPMIPEEDWIAIWDFYKASAPSTPLSPPAKPKSVARLNGFHVRKLNFHSGMPLISLIKIDPERKRLYVGDAFAGLLAAVNPAGEVQRTIQVGSPPVSLSITESGLLVTLIGRLFPSDLMEGSVVMVPADFASPPRTLLSELRRPTDARLVDLDRDGRRDLAVCSFGNRLGQFAWYQDNGTGRFQEHVLMNRPGATVCEIADLNGDGRQDLVVLTGQAAEAITVFYNEGGGKLRAETLVEYPPSYGLVSFQLVDFNKDGHLDLLLANGDNGDNPTPHKRYHGVRLLLNDGRNRFEETWFYPMEGAYKARAVDFDEDGDLDIAAISFYPDFSQEAMEDFVYLENRGNLQFAPFTFPDSKSGRWMVMDAGDLDGDGDDDIVLGSFALGPTTIPVPPELREHWKANGAAVVILENLRHSMSRLKAARVPSPGIERAAIASGRRAWMEAVRD